MGSLIGLNKTFVDLTELVLPFVDEDEGTSLSEAILAPKPKQNPSPEPYLYRDGDGNIHISNGTKPFLW